MDYQHEQDDGIPNFHNSLLAESASLDVDPLINRVTTPIFIVTGAKRNDNDIRKLKRKYGEDAPAHEDGGAKTIILAGAFRYLTLSTAQVDLAINLTHNATQHQIRD
ncbi:hypothetical protein CKM354_000731500 [Cercospora kikuchii]|uniref:Uncharacterized protein n=1 Tax=Cercospora kikuchii TaxID=84275 RepID=A0A9P3CKW5_9PEZI|nr:uncharacterized protein CKM354_000731500 [Cercospora kikuchii]GIZ44106.1 hypothetical protein CKM354_000731500 [Cercospora kikuchii]